MDAESYLFGSFLVTNNLRTFNRYKLFAFCIEIIYLCILLIGIQALRLNHEFFLNVYVMKETHSITQIS